jgi:carbonic anhydrase
MMTTRARFILILIAALNLPRVWAAEQSTSTPTAPATATKAAQTSAVVRTAAPADAIPANGDEALQRLLEGNKRYVQSAPSHPHQTSARRAEVVQGQHPFAVVLGCSDSRVSPEITFDAGVGDLFVVRLAGNILTDQGIGSIEYAVEHLSTPLVVVLGHGKCGAVTAAVAGGHAPGRIHTIVESLEPSVKAVQGQAGDAVALATKANVERVVRQLKEMQPILDERVKGGKLKIVGGVYDITTGAVEILP